MASEPKTTLLLNNLFLTSNTQATKKVKFLHYVYTVKRI